MMSLGNLVDKVKTVLHINVHPTCNHDYKPNGQIWIKVDTNYQIQNRKTCTLCQDDLLEPIGAK